MLLNQKLSWKLAICALGIGVAVILDAYAAHGLPKIVNPDRVVVFEKANRYLMFHCLSMSVLFAFNNTTKNLFFQIAQYLMAFGTVLFCSTLYLSSFRDVNASVIIHKASALAPIGGMSLISSWFIFAIGLFLFKNK